MVEPNTTYDFINEWTLFAQDTVGDLGIHTTTLSTSNFNWTNLSIYPNPTNVDYIFVRFDEDIKVEVFNILGEKLIQSNIKTSNPKLNIATLSVGVYIMKLYNNGNVTTKKFIRQ